MSQCGGLTKLQIPQCSAYNYRMIKIKTAAILAFFVFTASFLACVDSSGNANSLRPANASASSENATAPKTNAEELGVLVKVPYKTEDIVWKEDTEKKQILAVMRFSSADANKLVADAGNAGTPEASIPVESWFPDELIAQSEMSGDAALKGMSYPANAFIQEPYNLGKIIRIDGTDYFILELRQNKS